MRLPLIVAPMFLVSGPELVLAACRAGAMGSFPFPNGRSIEVLDEWMTQINAERSALQAADPERTVGPWAANMVVHRSYDRFKEELELVVKHKPPVVITALGSPDAVIDAVHGYGGLVFADVNNVAFARRAASFGVDALVLVAAGAGGHTGTMAGFAFVPAVREFFDGAVALGGSLCDGRAIRAAEILGADFACMGTSFIAAQESLASQEYRQMVVDSCFEDLVVTNLFTGGNASYMRGSIENMGLDPDNLGTKSKMDLTGSQERVKAWKEVWSAGQGVGSIKEIQTAEQIIAKLEREYRAAVELPSFGA
ncbi:MAG: nitronate monooxygenase [bacterium]|nr:nitronate monooxygenase [bacterium]